MTSFIFIFLSGFPGDLNLTMYGSPFFIFSIAIFQVLGFKVPKFAHTAPLEKAEEESRRKLSKRKDPEAAVSYYTEEGIPKEALKEYLMNIANSNFEIWRKQNPDKDMMEDFEFNLNKMGVSGADLLYILLLL